MVEAPPSKNHKTRIPFWHPRNNKPPCGSLVTTLLTSLRHAGGEADAISLLCFALIVYQTISDLSTGKSRNFFFFVNSFPRGGNTIFCTQTVPPWGQERRHVPCRRKGEQPEKRSEGAQRAEEPEKRPQVSRRPSHTQAARSFRAAFLLIFSVFIKPVFVNGRFSEGSRHAAAAFFGRLRCQIMPMAKPMTAGSSQPRFLSNSGRLAAANRISPSRWRAA